MASKAPSRTTAKTPTRAAAKPAVKPATKAPVKAPVKPIANKAAPKPAKVAKAPVAEPVAEARAAKPPKAKLVRDSFTMPQSDFALIGALKDRALGFKRPTKKSELLRAGLQALAALDAAALQRALNALAPLKPGRPKKGD
jgi:hypothetical protein